MGLVLDFSGKDLAQTQLTREPLSALRASNGLVSAGAIVAILHIPSLICYAQTHTRGI